MRIVGAAQSTRPANSRIRAFAPNRGVPDGNRPPGHESVDLAGCCHDLAYRVGVPRKTADKIWLIVATSGTRRVGWFRGRLGWLGLRIGAKLAYNPTGDPFRRHKSDIDDRDACDA